jgi:hypothetical protein
MRRSFLLENGGGIYFLRRAIVAGGDVAIQKGTIPAEPGPSAKDSSRESLWKAHRPYLGQTPNAKVGFFPSWAMRMHPKLVGA